MRDNEIFVFSSENREKIINNRVNLLTKRNVCVKMTNVSVSLLVVPLAVISKPTSGEISSNAPKKPYGVRIFTLV